MRSVFTLMALMFPLTLFAATASDKALSTADTSSPRSTLMGFYQSMHERYETGIGQNGLIQSYLRSGQLFMNPADAQAAVEAIRQGRIISSKFFDLSQVPKAIVMPASWRISTQLMEILIRVNLPSPDSIPDEAAMEDKPFKRWTLPGTELRIARVESGPRAGEYLFTEETVAHIPEFFHEIRSLPPREGEAKGMYEMIYDTPSGIAMYVYRIIPPRWVILIPEWTKIHIFNEPIWRWFGFFVVIAVMLRLIGLSFRITRRITSNNPLHRMGGDLIPLITLLVLLPVTIGILGEVLRFTPVLFGSMSLTLWGAFYLLLTWLVWCIGNLIAEWVISIERVKVDSTDSQLVRVALRLISITIGIGILIEGANRLGLPSYSIFAGLGVGGLAFALAGQQTIGNLLGSLIIMFEKPFRIGHTIKSGSLEGIVEHIGFRTAKIRTPEGNLLYVPSSEIIRHAIENRTLRDNWRVMKTLHLSLDNPIDQVVRFKDLVAGILEADVEIISGMNRTLLTDIGTHGYEVLIDYTVGTSREDVQRIVTERVLVQIGAVAKSLGISFSHALVHEPTETHGH